MVAKYYNVGDTVWIYGVSLIENRLTQGTVVKIFQLESDQLEDQRDYYVISVPSAIENLLEVRTWETISQDAQGPVGAIRLVMDDNNTDSSHKKMSQLGYVYDFPSVSDPDDPSPDEVNAVIDRISQGASPSARPVRKKTRYFPKKKKP